MGGSTDEQLILASTILKPLKLPIVYQQGQTEEFRQGVARVPGWFNYKFIEKLPTDIAKTIMARDFKGFSSGFDSTNGVLEWNQES